MTEQRERPHEKRWEERFCPACGQRHAAGIRPAYQFFPDAEESETGLKIVSLSAFGLWRRMLNFMHEGVPRGWLVTASGKKIEAEQLARLVNEKPATVRKLLAELDENGVFSRTEDGVIYSRRMIRDEHISNVRAAAGSKGGNPDLLKQTGAGGSDLLNQNPKQILTPASAPAVALAFASAVAPAFQAPLSSSSSSAATSSIRERGSTETVPMPRSALPPAALFEPEKENGNGGSERPAPSTARDAKSRALSMLAVAFVDRFYPLGQYSADRRADVTKGLKRLLLGRGERYKGKLLHASEEQLKDAIAQLNEAMPIDDPNAAWPFVLGCIVDLQDSGSFLGATAAAEESREPARAEAVALEWPERLTAHFRKEVGHVERAQVARALADYVSAEGLSVIESAISLYAMDRRADGKSMSFKFFLGEIATWIDGAKDPIVDDSGTITAFGHRITRPAIAAGASVSLGNQRNENLERARKIGEDHPDWRAEIEESVARAYPGTSYEQRWRDFVAPDLIDWEEHPSRRVFRTQKVTQ